MVGPPVSAAIPSKAARVVIIRTVKPFSSVVPEIKQQATNEEDKNILVQNCPNENL